MISKRSLLAVLLLCLHWRHLTGNDTYDLLYSDVQPANLSESFHRVKLIPLKHFEFIHDSVPGRRQMGVIGPDAQKFFPESVEVVPTYTIPNKDRKQPPTILTNYPLVDKSVIFMHGLAAMQELIRLHDSLDNSLNSLLKSRESTHMVIAEINRRLSMEVDVQLVDRKKLIQSEIEMATKELELDLVRAEEEKKAIEGEIKEEKALLQYEEELARRRMDYQEQLASNSQEKSLNLERDLAEIRQSFQRVTGESLQKRKMEHAIIIEEKKQNFEVAKIRAEIEAKAEQERANEDLTIRKMQAQAKLDTQRTIDAIRSVAQHIVSIATDFFSRPERLFFLLLTLLGLSLIYYAFRKFIVVLTEFIKARLGRPSLVRETSVHWNILPRFLSPVYLFSWFLGESLKKGKKKIEDHLQDVILSKDDKQRVIQLALATRNTKRLGAPFRHLLLHGPPGTGKTLIARRLAECSGMDYAIMSGGDVGPLGEDAVSQLHGLFRWASRSQKGLLVFIDEAEAFLSVRGKIQIAGADNTHVRHALNALLYQTGTQSKSFMMVLATNRPEDLDTAILDRIDVSIYIGLPAVEERQSLVNLYMENNLSRIAQKTQSKWWPFAKRYYLEEGCNTNDIVNTVARECDGFSGREISKLFIACHYAMFMADKGKLTMSLFKETVANKIQEHQQKTGSCETLKKSDDAKDSTKKSNRSSKPGIEVEEIQSTERDIASDSSYELLPASPKSTRMKKT